MVLNLMECSDGGAGLFARLRISTWLKKNSLSMGFTMSTPVGDASQSTPTEDIRVSNGSAIEEEEEPGELAAAGLQDSRYASRQASKRLSEILGNCSSSTYTESLRSRRPSVS